MSAKTTLTALAAIAVLGAASGARAQPATDRDTIMARLFAAHLELDTDAGARAVLGRILTVARGLCGGEPSGGAPADRERFAGCVTTTVDRAVAMLGSTRLTELNRRIHDGDVIEEAHR